MAGRSYQEEFAEKQIGIEKEEIVVVQILSPVSCYKLVFVFIIAE